MEIVQPGFELVNPTEMDIQTYPKLIEIAGRTCYKSEDRITEDSSDKFVKRLIKNGHESVLEHFSITVRIICDRSTSHQLVRHRLAAYSQESQRYCNYAGNKKSEKGIQIICPPSIKEKGSDEFLYWVQTMQSMEKVYRRLIEIGIPAEDARSVLPNAVKTEVVTTYNLRTWRHVFDERCSPRAQWQIRGIMLDILRFFHSLCPTIFEDKMKKFRVIPV